MWDWCCIYDTNPTSMRAGLGCHRRARRSSRALVGLNLLGYGLMDVRHQLATSRPCRDLPPS
jgi:predicted NAD-dependent protein-ADP-ribosyltransferase YbiA (DUF1768 family)